MTTILPVKQLPSDVPPTPRVEAVLRETQGSGFRVQVLPRHAKNLCKNSGELMECMGVSIAGGLGESWVELRAANKDVWVRLRD